jgi:cytochrome c oxidase subunit IV
VAKHGHDEHGGHLAHVASVKVLVGVFAALLFLTVITVLAAQVDFGSKKLNLGIAMLIAAVKASLVMLYFMHLRYDRLFHTVIIAAGILAATLFVGFALVDRGQYEDTVEWDPQNPPTIQREAPPLTPAL